MTRDEQKFFDKALIAAMSSIIAKVPLRDTNSLDGGYAKAAGGAEMYALELLKTRRKND